MKGPIFNLLHTVQQAKRLARFPINEKLISLTPDFEASFDWKLKNISNIFLVKNFRFYSKVCANLTSVQTRGNEFYLAEVPTYLSAPF